MNIYDFKAKAQDGSDVSLGDYKGDVLLIVNTATGCGFTPQYKELEALYEKFHDKKFEILDFPCNQFLGQAPGTDSEIHSFCTLKYNTQFPQFSKIEVNGENQDPIFAYLKEQAPFKGLGDSDAAKMMPQYIAKVDPDWQNNDNIKWNFTKFLVNRDGDVIARFEPTEGMDPVNAAVEKAVAE